MTASSKSAQLAPDVPVVIRLEALLRTDLTLEGLLALLKQQPQLLVLSVWWWVTGRLAREVGERSPLEVRWLPYRDEVLEWVARARAAGAPVRLVSTAPSPLVDAIALHVGASGPAWGGEDLADPARNLPERFLLLTDPSDDSALAKRAGWVERVSGAHVAGAPRPGRWRVWFKALRVHQWAKNLLILVPVLAAHRVGEPGLLLSALVALAAFSACASSVYILNDLLDLPSDRRHASKSRRPFAAGTLALSTGLWLAPLLLVFAFGLAVLLLPPLFAGVLGAYWLVTSSYSLWLKQVAILDVLTLSGLYTVRLVAGAVATRVVVSDWLLIFSTFLFLSLALVKRFAEVQRLREGGEAAHGRGYAREDLPLLGQLGGAAGYLSVLVLALYIHSPQISRLYARPDWLWLACPLALYWISRVWLLAHRGQMNDDPVVFALRDRASHAVAALGLLLLWLAS